MNEIERLIPESFRFRKSLKKKLRNAHIETIHQVAYLTEPELLSFNIGCTRGDLVLLQNILAQQGLKFGTENPTLDAWNKKRRKKRKGRYE